MNKVSYYLASANSLDGFKNFFDNIDNNKDSFVYILKGGPGTGKSSLMKKIGAYYENKKYDVEYFFCSSDSTSLDAIKIPQKKIIIVDGTAPHVVEATEIGVKEKIINPGDFISDDVKCHKSKIEFYLSKKKNYYSSAYNFLKSAKELFNNELFEFNIKNKINSKISYTINVVFKEKIDDLIKYLNIENQNCESKVRKLFGSYISKDGISYIYDKNHYSRKIILNGNYLENIQILNIFCNILKDFGYKITEFKSLFNTDYTEAVYIENIDSVLYACDFSNQNIKFQHKKLIYEIIKKAGQRIDSAINNHKKVEEFYVKNMDFKRMDEYTDKIFNLK